MADEPRDELLSSLDKLLKDGTYSDLTISSGENEYKVHKAIVCPRSTFFEKACSSRLKEGCTGIINLPEDDPTTIELMIDYLYRLDYPHVDEVAREPLDSTPGDEFTLEPEHEPEPDPDPEFNIYTVSFKKKRKKAEQRRKEDVPFVGIPDTPNLVIHARLYAIGEKYGVTGLKTLAMRKFEKEVGYHWKSEDFIQAVEEVFTSTVEGDKGLRDIVVDTIARYPDLLDKQQLQDVVKSCDLSFELMMKFRRSFRRW